MTREYYSQLDTSYSDRYKSRNQKKINSICEHIQNEPVKNVLDIGCNQGYVTKSLLDRNIVEFGYGVDLEEIIVSPELIKDERFTFFEEDIIKFTFPQKFDVVVYNSVHHHIFANYGSETAFKVWRAIVSNCNQFIFFETAVLTEQGPALYWKDELGTKYKDDNHMMADIFTRIGPRLKNIKIISSNKIHWSERPLYKISLYPLPNNEIFSVYVKNSFPELMTKDSLWSIEKEMVRSEGSKNQILIDRDKLKNTREINKDVKFFILNKKNEDNKYFGKRYSKDVYRQIRELTINQKTNHPRILKTCFASEKYGLVSEHLPWQKITEIDFNNIKNKKKFTNQITEFFSFFKRTKIEYGNTIDPIANITNRKYLYEVIDLNINNFLVQIEKREIADWKAIDFDFSLVNTKAGNQINYLSINNAINQNSKCAFVYKFLIHFNDAILYSMKLISSRLFYFNLGNLKIFFSRRLKQIYWIIMKYLIKPISK